MPGRGEPTHYKHFLRIGMAFPYHSRRIGICEEAGQSRRCASPARAMHNIWFPPRWSS